ncbi:MAG: hypothetical protein ACQCN5_07920 [Candidatus Bathyarchaeia archaeon]
MDYYLLLSTGSLIVQLAILAFLIVGVGLKRQKRFRQHGLLMTVALVLHLISIAFVMGPSFQAIAFTVTGLSVMVVALSVVHGVLGLISLVLGIWVILAWRFRQSLQYCAPKKKVMLATFTSWIVALLIGAALYFILYLPLIA